MSKIRRLIAVSLVFALIMGSAAALAEANWWNDIGPTESALTPEPTPKPRISLSGLLGGLLSGAKTDTEKAPVLDTSEEHTGDVLPDDYDYRAEEGEDGLPYDDSEEGDFIEEGEYFPEDDPDALFGIGVRDITGRAYGNAVQCAMLNGGWTVRRAYYLDNYRVTADHMSSYGRQVMADAVMMNSFVPAGDGIIYYGEATKGAYSWLYKQPGDASPYALPLKDGNGVFYADQDYIWYFTYGSGSSRPISRMGYDGKNKKQLGKQNGTVIAMMDDGSVLIAHYSKDQVVLWKDGKSEVIYDPKKEITNVISTGRSIWVQHEQEFGLLEDGKLTFTFPGYIRSEGKSSDQLVFVVESREGAARFDVLMFNDSYRAWARVGDIKAQVNLNVELWPPRWMTIWGPEESMEYPTPEQGAWLPYGHYDLESAMDSGFTPARSGANTLAGDDAVERRISEALFLEGEDEILKDADERDIYVTHDRDGMYSYLNMTTEQYNKLLFDRSLELQMQLELLVTMGLIDSYDEHGDFSLITLYTNAESAKDEALLNSLNPIGILATAYQAFLYGTEAPECIIYLTDLRADVVLETLHGPGDFLIG